MEKDRAISVVEQAPRLVAAKSDERIIELWLHGRPETTQGGYRADVQAFLRFVGKGLKEVTLDDVQAFSDSMLDRKPRGRARVLSAVKSLLKFAHVTGYLPFDVGAPVRLPKVKDDLAQRILTEEQVQRMLALEPDPRNHALLRLLYAAGGRVSEIAALTWKDLQPRETGGQIALFGKGGKTRYVLVKPGTWEELTALKGSAKEDAPVFQSRKGGHLTRVQILRIVKAAAERAGIKSNVSPHWFRHAHASHSLDRGCPTHEVQATLGHASLATTSRYAHTRPNTSSALYLPV